MNHKKSNIKLTQIDIHTDKILKLFDSIKDAKKTIVLTTIGACLQGK